MKKMNDHAELTKVERKKKKGSVHVIANKYPLLLKTPFSTWLSCKCLINAFLLNKNYYHKHYFTKVS